MRFCLRWVLILLGPLFAPALASAHEFTFVVMSDPQFGMYTDNRSFAQETANFSFAIATANRLYPAFVVVCGDLTNKAADPNQLAEYQRISHLLDRSIPLHNLAGNHDVGNNPTPESLASYRRQYGPDYYFFRRGTFEGIVLNSSLIQHPEKAAAEAAKQEAWLEDKLRRAQRDGVGRVVVFQHIPWSLKTSDEPDQYFNIPTETRRRFLALFHHYGVEHAYAGHYHRNDYGRDGSLEMVTTAPVGKPLGKEGSGFRIVRVREGVFESTYYNFGEMPVSAWDKPQALAAP